MSAPSTPRSDVLVLGESLIDIVDRGTGEVIEHVGGSAANVAVALARQHVAVSFATSFGADDRGTLIRRRLLTDDVALATSPYVVPATSTALASIGPDGSASYTFDIDWRLGPVPTDPPPLVAHLCSYSAIVEPGATTVEATIARLAATSTITYDINMRPTITGLGADVVDRVLRTVSRSTIVKASDEDLELLMPGSSLDEAAARLAGLGPTAVVVTRGSAGASVWLGRRRIDVPAPRTVVADTIGAGDTFMAGLIAALVERGLVGRGRAPLADAANHVWADVLEHAATSAAISVSRPGADPPYRSELERRAPATEASQGWKSSTVST